MRRSGKPRIGPISRSELDMNRLSHRKVRLSIALLGAAALGGALVSAGGQPAAAAPGGSGTSPYYGRWQVSDADARFSARGRAYRTIDIAPCGRDFCGVSVSDAGACGATLFRFLTKNNHGDSRLQGHGSWGTIKKNVVIDLYKGEVPADSTLQLYLGNGWDFGERSDNMPMFEAGYSPRGRAQCTAR